MVKTATKDGGNSRKEITQCRRQSHRSEGAPAESGGGTKIKLTFAHKKLIFHGYKLCAYLAIFVFMSKKKRRIRPTAFLSSFRIRLI